MWEAVVLVQSCHWRPPGLSMVGGIVGSVGTFPCVRPISPLKLRTGLPSAPERHASGTQGKAMLNQPTASQRYGVHAFVAGVLTVIVAPLLFR